jgi:hypothetical protein
MRFLPTVGMTMLFELIMERGAREARPSLPLSDYTTCHSDQREESYHLKQQSKKLKK